ncbi:endocuticle structural glycoprotein ABD-5-like [Rhynchophorus ferrugineus]|uniref:Uncharacterized protein n=1 Tax=Rhynchophorus ferrugineus TaxID=354439 RepID=A0A834HYU2_RHYFE|nr:hypothetical protein GWI33_017742 [Rhynchophorus ferrugineus]
MKAIILFLALIGLSKARPQLFRNTIQQVRFVPYPTILRNYYDLDNPRGYKYAVQTSDGFNNAVIGEIKNPGTDQESLAVEGQYSYQGPDGKMYTVHYTADENGFQPSGEHLTGSANTKRKLGIPSAALASLAGGGLG